MELGWISAQALWFFFFTHRHHQLRNTSVQPICEFSKCILYNTEPTGYGGIEHNYPARNVQFFVVDIIAHRENIEIYKDK